MNLDHGKARATKVARAGLMADHVAQLAEAHGINVELYTGGGRAFPRERSISIRPVRGVSTYYVALHEIGHIVGRGRSAPKLEQEANAWQWAIEHAALKPTPGVRKMIRRCLRSYLARHERMSARRRTRWPSSDHACWALADVTPEWGRYDDGRFPPQRMIFHGE